MGLTAYLSIELSCSFLLDRLPMSGESTLLVPSIVTQAMTAIHGSIFPDPFPILAQPLMAQFGGATWLAPFYREYNPDSAGTRRDECLVGDSRRQVLVDGDKVLKWFRNKLRGLRVNQ